MTNRPDTRTEDATEVAIGVITCRRPNGLNRLLGSLERLEMDQRRHVRIEVVVVDNDAQQSARAVCRRLEPNFRWKLRCMHEPRRGIPFARNTVIRIASPRADFIAFVDDDETVDPDWLESLLSVQEAYRADAVTGPALPKFDRRPPEWVRRGNFFQPTRHATGTRVAFAYTGNILYRADLLRRAEMRFDERIAQTGGSDMHQTRKMTGAAYTIVWSDAAITHEWWPASRISVGWLCQRAFRFGTSQAFIEFDLLPFHRAFTKMGFGGAERLVKGTFDLATACLVGTHRAVRGLTRLSAGTGMLLGILGVRYHEYRRIHGE